MNIRKILWIGGGALLLLLFAANILIGSAELSLAEVLQALFGSGYDDPSNGISSGNKMLSIGAAADIAQNQVIIKEIRLPRALTALLSGAAISLSGLLMQTLFRNPLAGPYVLGISSGASLGAAICVLSISSSAAIRSSILGSLGIAGAAWIGAAVVLGIIASASRKIGDITIILILGMMLGAGIDAIVQILQYLSDEQSLKTYILWTMGSLGHVTGHNLLLLSLATLLGTGIIALMTKQLNLLLLGETYALTSGLDLRLTRTLSWTATVLLAGTVTAFCGPLGFIGLAVPHIARLICSSSDHCILIPATFLCGSCLMLGCDLVSKTAAIPINAVTSLIGVPTVVWVVLKNLRK